MLRPFWARAQWILPGYCLDIPWLRDTSNNPGDAHTESEETAAAIATHLSPPTYRHPLIATHLSPPTYRHPLIATHLSPPTYRHPLIATHLGSALREIEMR